MGTTTKYVASRTCNVIDDGEPQIDGGTHAPLSDYADCAAYVLIAEPGAGKTTAFKTESAAQGAVCVTVRDFLTFDKPEWRDTTLFLDGLDESRAGTVDGRATLDQLRKKLDDLDRPRFRLSCRWGDWLATNDRESLRETSPDGQVTVIRLDPLSKENIKAILANNHGFSDPDEFIAAARKRGVEPLLSNPQNLVLLAMSVAEGNWPDSRRETFERACEILVREANGEHRIANPSSTETVPLLDAAGRLCAVQLLAGHAGYTLPDRAEPDKDYPSLADIGEDMQGRARQVLGTRQFKGVSEGRLAPVHRQIAEFLAARRVSELLQGGLPLERVLALITGFDGELITQFGNFVSWLAVHSKASRKALSRLDPSGLIYFGDQEIYSPEDKREIVLNLRREWAQNPHCFRHHGRVAGFGRIVSPELEDTFREILSGEERGIEQQSYVNDILQMLADGDPMAGLSDLLEKIVRDATWRHGVRCWALDVLTGYSEQGCLDSSVLVTVIRDIAGGLIEDPDDELLGILLKALYPKVLPMAEVKMHLREPRLKDRTGAYSRFWTDHVPRESTTEQLSELLDKVAMDLEECRKFFQGEVGTYTCMSQLPIELLEKVLRPIQGDVDSHRLYNWLNVVSDSSLQVVDWKLASIKSRLKWKEETLKSLITHAVELCVENREDLSNLIDRRLLGARPLRYGRWCLQQVLSAENPTVSSFFLRELFDCVMDGHRADGLTIEGIRTGLADNESLLNQFDQWSECSATVQQRQNNTKTPQKPGKGEKEVADQAPLTTGESVANPLQASPEILHRAAEAYLGISEKYKGRSPRDRLSEFTGGYRNQVDDLLSQIEGTISRTDLPDWDNVVRLFDNRGINLLVLPFAAGLHSLEQTNRLSISELGKNKVRLAVTMLYTLPRQCFDPNNGDRSGVPRPKWFQNLLKDDSALVADVLCRTAALKLETGLQPAIELQEMATSGDHEIIAKLASLRVLQDFPKAETEAALISLCWSLHAALANSDWSKVEPIIMERFHQGGLSGSERSCWVIAGFLTMPEAYREKLQSLTEDEDRLKWLVQFLSVKRFRRELAQRLSAKDIKPLVAVLAVANQYRCFTQDAYWWISHLIMTLVDDTSGGADDTVEMLSHVPNAELWSPDIAYAKETRTRKQREAEYRHSDLERVIETLQNRSPANAGDLAALVFDKLTELSKKIRDGNTSDWRQHWNVDGHNHLESPKPENACRDAVLSDLQLLLVRLGVDAQREGSYAEDNRADIRVSFDGFNVPVEVKRSCHADLWTAIQEQLIAKYTRDPGAEGFGIYLVFWFGDTEKCRPTALNGCRPESVDGLRQKLEQSLSDSERNLISICVVDVSDPRGMDGEVAAATNES